MHRIFPSDHISISGDNLKTIRPHHRTRKGKIAKEEETCSNYKTLAAAEKELQEKHAETTADEKSKTGTLAQGRVCVC